MQEKTIAYLAGPISNTKILSQRQVFNHAAYILRQSYEWSVINPLDFDSRLPKEISYSDKINLGLCLLSMCNTLVLLPGWERSKGAQLERAWAITHGIKIYDYNTEEDYIYTEVEE